MANGEVTTGELYRRIEDMAASMAREFGHVNHKLDTMSERTAANETEIAVIKDRANRPALHGGIAGGIVGALWFIAEWLKSKAAGQ